MPDKSKFERELDEILEKTEDNPAPPSERQRSAGQHRAFEPFATNVPKSKPPKRNSSIKFNPGNLILGGLAIVAIAAFIPAAQLPVAVLGIILVVVGYILWFRKGSSIEDNPPSTSGMFGRGKSPDKSQPSEPEVKYWRGRKIEDKPAPRDSGKIIDFGSPDDDEGKD